MVRAYGVKTVAPSSTLERTQDVKYKPLRFLATPVLQLLPDSQPTGDFKGLKLNKNIDIFKRYYALSAIPSRMRTIEQRREIAYLEVAIRKMSVEDKRVARMSLATRK